ncbi:MAG TPA: hypothetical protein VM536_11540, partial [Chloroflexia bacterium]|nr:hypothetical protein [Chloroflexia bacterium]
NTAMASWWTLVFWASTGALTSVLLTWIAVRPTRKVPLWRWGLLVGLGISLLSDALVFAFYKSFPFTPETAFMSVAGLVFGTVLAVYFQWRLDRLRRG